MSSLGTIGYTGIGRAHGERAYGPDSNNEIAGQSIITANVGFDIGLGNKRKDVGGVMRLGKFLTNEELVTVPNEFVFYRKGARGKTGVASGIDGFTSFNGLDIEDVFNDDDLRRLYPYIGFNQGDTQLDENVSVTRSGIAVGVAGSFTRFNDTPYTFTPGSVACIDRPSIDRVQREKMLRSRKNTNSADAPPLTKLTASIKPFNIEQIVNWFRDTADSVLSDLKMTSGFKYDIPKVMHEIDVQGKSRLLDRDLVNLMRKRFFSSSVWAVLTAAERYGLIKFTAMNEHTAGVGGFVGSTSTIASSQGDYDAYRTLIEQVSLDNPDAKVVVFDTATSTYVIETLNATQQADRARKRHEVAEMLGVNVGIATDENRPWLIEDGSLMETLFLPILGPSSQNSAVIQSATKMFNKTFVPDNRNKMDIHVFKRNAFGSVPEQINQSLRSCEESYVRSVARIYDNFSTDIVGTLSNHSRPGGPAHFAT